MLKKKLFLISIFIIISKLLFTEEKLSEFNTSWTSVLPGIAICQPAETSYGFCLATDARNLMGFSSDGKLLWEKKIARSRNISISTLNSDFILFNDKDKNTIQLYNPSGSQVWSKSLNFTPFDQAFDGRDGRFFIYGEKTIICFGINGIERWRLETEYQKKLPMQELPDGSLVLFLNDVDGKTRGLRISPFGEELEKITFAGSIKTADSCSEGILLTFTDGTAGLFSLQDGYAKSRWVAGVKNGNPVFVINSDKSQYRLLSLSKNEITIYKLDNTNGSVLSSKVLKNFDGSTLLLRSLTEAGLFLADDTKACLIDYEYNEIWSAFLPEAIKNKTINQLLYLNNNYLIFCSKNWSVNAYHTSQTTRNSSKVNKSVLKNRQADYSSFVSLDLSLISYSNQNSFYNSLKDPKIAESLKNGGYGKKESQWLSQALSIARLYSIDEASSDFGIHTGKSVFETDSAGFEAVLIQLSLLGTDQTQAAAASIIAECRNKTYCRPLLANLIGYDPEGKLLDAIEKNTSLAGNKDSAYLSSICDAVYKICFFMGRPAYNTKGKEILKKLMGNAYNLNTRNYARNTFKKILSLEL